MSILRIFAPWAQSYGERRRALHDFPNVKDATASAKAQGAAKETAAFRDSDKEATPDRHRPERRC
jgi:hypothetical protein